MDRPYRAQQMSRLGTTAKGARLFLPRAPARQCASRSKRWFWARFRGDRQARARQGSRGDRSAAAEFARRVAPPRCDRKSVVQGKGVSVRVDLGGRRIIHNKKASTQTNSTNT